MAITAWLPAATLVALVLSLAASAVALGVAHRCRRDRLQAAGEPGELLRSGEPAEALRLVIQRVEELVRAQEATAQELARLAERVRHTLSHSGLVRFDALEEHTGELSFSMALVDDTQTGVVITSIAGRQQTRVYAKAVRNGQPSVVLSDEERQALAQAVGRVL